MIKNKAKAIKKIEVEVEPMKQLKNY